MDEFEDDYAPIFRGATKPTMFFGIPMMALGAVAFPLCLIGLWGTMIFGFVGMLAAILPLAVAVPIMRDMTKRDDQYLKMYGLNAKEFMATRQNKIDTVRIVPPKAVRSTKFMEY